MTLMAEHKFQASPNGLAVTRIAEFIKSDRHTIAFLLTGIKLKEAKSETHEQVIGEKEVVRA